MEKSISLPFPAARVHLHALACGLPCFTPALLFTISLSPSLLPPSSIQITKDHPLISSSHLPRSLLSQMATFTAFGGWTWASLGDDFTTHILAMLLLAFTAGCLTSGVYVDPLFSLPSSVVCLLVVFSHSSHFFPSALFVNPIAALWIVPVFLILFLLLLSLLLWGTPCGAGMVVVG